MADTKKQSLFNDKSAEMNMLSGGIKESVNNLNGQLKALDVSSLYATQHSSLLLTAALQDIVTERRQKAGKKQSVMHSVGIVDQLKSRLMAATKEFQASLQVEKHSNMLRRHR